MCGTTWDLVQIFLGGKDVLIRSSETRARMEQSVRDLQLTYLDHEGHVLPPQTPAIVEFLRAVSGYGTILTTSPVPTEILRFVT